MNDQRHEALASVWAAYNSLNGKAAPKQVARIMKQCDAPTLERLLGERGLRLVEVAS
jgi:hypothetical protein